MTEKELDRLFQQISNGQRCKECGRPSQCVHHYISRRNEILRWEVFNAIPVCLECHNKIHTGEIKIITDKHIGKHQREWCDSRKNISLKDELLFRGLTRQEYYKEKSEQLKRNVLCKF